MISGKIRRNSWPPEWSPFIFRERTDILMMLYPKRLQSIIKAAAAIMFIRRERAESWKNHFTLRSQHAFIRQKNLKSIITLQNWKTNWYVWTGIENIPYIIPSAISIKSLRMTPNQRPLLPQRPEDCICCRAARREMKRSRFL